MHLRSYILPRVVALPSLLSFFFCCASAQADCAPPPSGLISFWTGDNTTSDFFKIDNGTLENGASYTNGEVGQAFYFSADAGAAGQYVDVGAASNLWLQNFTIETWIKRDSGAVTSFDPTGYASIFGYGEGGYSLSLDGQGHPLITDIGVGGAFASKVISDTSWHQVAAVVSNHTAIFYIDGASAGTAAANYNYQFSTDAAIGARSDGGANSFFGAIDEVAVFNRPLRSNEIQAIYAAGSAGLCENLGIAVQPTNEFGVIGGTNVFYVGAYGPPPLAYQWRFNSQSIPGETNATLTLTNVQLTNVGTYSVIVSDSAGRIVSSDATLTVLTPVSITIQPTNINATLGAYAQFTVTAQGSAPLGYQWTFNGAPIPNATNDAYSITSVTFTNLGTYAVVVTNPVSEVTSDPAVLALNPQVTVSGQLGTNFTFTNVTSVQVEISTTFKDGTIFYTLDGSTPTPSSTSYTGPFSLPGSAVVRAIAYDQSFNSALSLPVSVSLVESCISPPNGLASWWPAEGTAVDITGTNHGTLVNGASFTNGEAGQAFSFHGLLQAVSVGSAASLQLQNFTIEGWIKRSSNALVTLDPLGSAELFAFGQGGYGFGFSSGAGKLALSFVGLNQVISSGAVTDTNWHHVAVTKSSSTVSFYIDGATAGGSVLGGGFTFRTNAAIGARGDTYRNSFYGAIDGLSIYNQALTLSQIQSIYAAARHGKCSPLAIIVQPTNEWTVAGRTNTFAVGASGSSPLAYQWLFDAKPIAGATNGFLTINDVSLTNAGSYSVVVSNQDGQIASSNAELTVVVPASIEVNPTNVAAVLGSPAAFSVSAAGTLPLAYQWTFDGTNILDATNSAYGINSVAVSNFGSYAVVVSNAGAAVTSSPALLEFNPQIIVNGQFGSSFSFTNVPMVQIQISSTFSNATIFYTLDGSTPTVGSTRYAGPFSLSDSATLRAIAYDQDFNSALSLPVSIIIVDGCTAPPAGLISWWPAEGDAIDAMGTNDGALLAGVSYTNGEAGQAFSFQGQSQAVTIGAASNLWLQSFTIEAWVKRYSTQLVSLDPQGSAMFFSFGTSGYGIGFSDAGGAVMLTKLGVSGAFSSTSITDTNFHHVAVATDGTNVDFYIDGKPAGTSQYSPGFVFNTPAGIGARGDDLDNSFYGAIDELAVYNRALTSNEIVAIYGAGPKGKCAALAFVRPPASQTNILGASTIFTAGAVGSAALSYQWTLNGLTLAGATNGTLALTNLEASNAGSYSVTVSNNSGQIVSSNAVLTIQAALSVTNSEGGVVTLSPSNSNSYYSTTQIIQATAVPTNGWSFLYWTGAASGTNPVIYVAMTNDQTLGAVFGTSIAFSPPQNGTFHVSPGLTEFPCGSTVQISALPAPGYYFGLWGATASGNVNPYVLTITNPNPAISALFAPLAPGNFSLVLIPNGNGSVSVSPAGNTFASNSILSISASPTGTNLFYFWTGDASGATNPLSLTLDSSKVVTANFTGGAYPLELLSPQLTPTNFTFGLKGLPFQAYEIDVSTNLTNWSFLTTVTNNSGSIPLSDAGSNSPQKFYRALPR